MNEYTHVSRAQNRKVDGQMWWEYIADRRTVQRKCNRVQGHVRGALIRSQEGNAVYTSVPVVILDLKEALVADSRELANANGARHAAICPTRVDLSMST